MTLVKVRKCEIESAFIFNVPCLFFALHPTADVGVLPYFMFVLVNWTMASYAPQGPFGVAGCGIWESCTRVWVPCQVHGLKSKMLCETAIRLKSYDLSLFLPVYSCEHCCSHC